jgi:hypothetical protein
MSSQKYYIPLIILGLVVMILVGYQSVVMDNVSDNPQMEKQAWEIYSRRLGERVIFLEQEIEDDLATSIIAHFVLHLIRSVGIGVVDDRRNLGKFLSQVIRV